MGPHLWLSIHTYIHIPNQLFPPPYLVGLQDLLPALREHADHRCPSISIHVPLPREKGEGGIGGRNRSCSSS